MVDQVRQSSDHKETQPRVSAAAILSIARPQENSVGLSNFANKYEKLEALFGKGNVVPIGGLASNLLNSQDSRFTPDRDFVAKAGIISRETLAAWQERADPLHFELKISKAFPFKLTITDLEDGGKIDLHYGDCRMSGVRKSDIVSTAHIERRVVGNRQFEYKVPDPSIFILMKFYAWADRGKSTQHKDACDIINTIFNHFGENVNEFTGQLDKSVDESVLDDYFKHLNKRTGKIVFSMEKFTEELRYMYADVVNYDIRHLEHTYKTWFVRALDKLKTSRDIERHLRVVAWNKVAEHYAQQIDAPELGGLRS
ncbi:MAG: hypothetical protein M1286_01760 [Candidatus Marsarchaeota archaeon]|nr:hypothetical protein [Candidatus Marsarchaeota archaeon]